MKVKRIAILMCILLAASIGYPAQTQSLRQIKEQQEKEKFSQADDCKNAFFNHQYSTIAAAHHGLSVFKWFAYLSPNGTVRLTRGWESSGYKFDPQWSCNDKRTWVLGKQYKYWSGDDCVQRRKAYFIVKELSRSENGLTLYEQRHTYDCVNQRTTYSGKVKTWDFFKQR